MAVDLLGITQACELYRAVLGAAVEAEMGPVELDLVLVGLGRG